MPDSTPVRLRRGFDIPLQGAAEPRILELPAPALHALKPTDFHGLAPIPKLEAREGDEVAAGAPIFFDKSRPGVRFTAPVSGELIEVRRGAKRAIREIVILADQTMRFHEFSPLDPESAPVERLVERLMESGALTLIRQRPFHVVPDPSVRPRDIFVSCFNTAPLAPDANFLIDGSEDEFGIGLRVLSRISGGGVHLGVSRGSTEAFTRADGVDVHYFSGPHPAGNVGIQIHHIRPISRGDVVWTLSPQAVAIIGRLFRDGIFDTRRRVALTGAELRTTGYVDTRIGATVQPWMDNNLSGDHVRIISGNVLTGSAIPTDGFLGLWDEQVTVIEQGDEPEFMGWLMPSYPRPSMSGTFLSTMLASLRPPGPFRVNSNTHGEPRAFVVTGQYEKVVPMDIYPQHLIKSILYRDFDQMEGLGLLEVVEEDLALCEFVCTSKQPVQQILREGLEALRREG